MRKKHQRFLRALALAANLAVIFCTLAGLFALEARGGRLFLRRPSLSLFRTFTVLSNVFAAAASALMLPFDLRALLGGREERPRWAVSVKFVSVCAVSVTFWTVLLFLGPVARYRGLYADSGFWLHLVGPVLAVSAFLLLERGGRLSPWEGLLGAAPVFSYGGLYFVRVVVQRAWKDFYLFNRGGHWPASMAAMFAAGLALAFALRFLYNLGRGK